MAKKAGGAKLGCWLTNCQSVEKWAKSARRRRGKDRLKSSERVKIGKDKAQEGEGREAKPRPTCKKAWAFIRKKKKKGGKTKQRIGCKDGGRNFNRGTERGRMGRTGREGNVGGKRRSKHGGCPNTKNGSNDKGSYADSD